MPTASDRLRKQAKKLTKDLRELRGTAKDVAQEKLRKIRENGSIRYGEGRGKVHRAELTVEHLIQHRPFKSVLIATGVGVVLGGLWIRRMMKSPAHAKHTA